MDSKRFNIYAGSILGALLLFMLLNFFSNLIYVGPEHGGHEDEVLAFAVPIEEEGGAAAEEEGPDLATLVAEADPSNGESVFNKCKACHALEQGKHGVGPSLHNVVGHDIAAADGFSYSDALAGLEGDWTLEELSAFLENPQGYAPGTKMGFAGIGNPQDRVDVIAYLNEQSDDPVELAPETTAAADTATDAAAEGEEQPAEGDQAEDAASEEATTEEAATDEAATETAAATGDTAEEPAATEEATTEEATTEEATTEAAATGGAGEYADLLAAASAEEGQKVYRRCQACHTLEEGKHRVGPSLYGLIGSDIGGAEGFNYSDAMAEFGGQWTLENLMGYLEAPNEFMPGNKMTFPGLDDPQDRINVFTYIDEADGERDLPEPQ